MFENLKAVCQYKTQSKIINGCPTYECTCGDDIATHRCSEEKCPFMKVINNPHTIPLNKYMTNTFNERVKVDEPTLYPNIVTRDTKMKVEPIDHGRVQCPVCKNHQLFKYQNYCGECGQHLDWEVE